MATLITDVHVFDGERSTSATAVRVVDGLIDACDDAVTPQPGDEVVEGAGGTLVPGLIDAHVHLLPGALRQALTFGVTTVLDMFSTPQLLNPAALQAATSTAVADVRSSGVGATAPGGHPSLMYAPFPTLSGPEAADAFVAERRSEGAAYLKLMYDADDGAGPFGWPSLHRATVAGLVRAAHRRGLLVVAHVTSTAAARDVVEEGVDVLAHVPIDPIDDRLVAAIRDRGVAVIATLATIESFAGSYGTELADDPHLAARIGPSWAAVLRSSATRWRAPGLPDASEALRNVGRLARAGIGVLAGSDAPNPGTVHGASLHRELELLVEAGLSPTDALASGTSVPADVFGLDDRGRIAPGKRADLVLLDGDPTTDIKATRRTRAVWREGQRCDLAGYVGSDDEAAGLTTHAELIRRVTDAARELWPEAAAAWGAEQST